MESVATNNAQAIIKNCPVFAGKSKDTFLEYKSKLRGSLSTASPYSKCFKARPSHLLWAAPAPRRLVSSLSTKSNR